jgi:hypothetical protein
MDITEHVEALRRDFTSTARAMGPEVEDVAQRIGFALDSAARLALLDALSHAAAEITTALEGASVEVRLDGREPVFVVVGAGPSALSDETAAVPASGDTTALAVDAEGAETARITLRLPDALKTRAEELAAGRGQSLNTWLVGAVRAATTAVGPATTQGPGAPGRNRRSNKRVQGWVR